MKKEIITILTLCLNLFAVKSIDIPQIVPTSPNAAGLGKYGSIPVSYYTGVPQILIPLYEIDIDGKKIPINISYHASGIKVTEEASNIGLGWSLNAGGAIIRQINQLNDFTGSDIGYYFEENFPAPLSGNNYNPINQSYEDYEKYFLNMRDGEPDYFYFNFANYSGKFFFKKIYTGNNNSQFANGVIQKKEYFLETQYDIVRDRWIVSDGDGFKYYFGTKETTYNYSLGGFQVNIHPEDINRNQLLNSPARPYQEITTAWMLDSIISPNNHKIMFEYNSDEIYTPVSLNENVYHLLSFKTYPCSDHSNSFLNVSTPESLLGGVLGKAEYYSYSMSKIVQKNISKIKTDNIEVTFSTSDRDDIEPVNTTHKPQKISELFVKNSNGEITKYYKFNYSYFGSKTGSKYINQKLCLDNIAEGVETPIRHTFNYNKSIVIPPKNTNQIDDWGYYNGAVASSNVWDIEPNTHSANRLITYIPEFQQGPNLYKGRKRIVSETNMKAGMLTSIIYPTKGEVTFDYEPNLVSGTDIDTEETVRTYLASVNMRNYVPNPDDEPDPSIPKYLSEFTLETKTDIVFSYYFNVVEWHDGIDDTQAYDCIVLKNKDTNKIIKTISFGGGTMYGFHEFSIPQVISGHYELILYNDMVYSPHKFWLSSTISYNKPINPAPSFENKAGGLRIKEINNLYNGENNKKTTYTYSAGTLMREPYYTALSPFAAGSTNGSCYVTFISVYGRSNSLTPFSNSANGCPVGYDWVKEDLGTMGKIIYYYHNNRDENPEDFEYDFVDLPGIPYLNNGLIKKKEYYNSSNKHVKDFTYEYDVNSEYSNIIKGLKFGNKNPLMTDDGFGNLYPMTDVYIKYYDVKSELWQLTSESETDYNDIEEAIRQSVTTYSYNDKINKPSSITTTFQDITTTQTNYKYPEDVNVDPSSVFLKNKNILNTPIEKINILDNRIIGAVKSVFDENALLKQELSLKTNTSLGLTDNYSLKYSTDFEVLKYNTYGNIVSIMGHDGIVTTYLWGYNNQYPIANIRNVTFSEVENIVRTIFSVADINELAKITLPNEAKLKDGSLQNALPNAQVTTYTYKPLVGILTATDPRGVTTHYEYDTLNRLTQTYIIENGVKKILQKYDYRYANQ